MTIQELMNLKGRRALITGAAGGLGTAMAETLAEARCRPHFGRSSRN